jgi:hypothetical protein
MFNYRFHLTQQGSDTPENSILIRGVSRSLLDVLEKLYVVGQGRILAWDLDSQEAAIPIDIDLEMYPTFESLMERITQGTLYALPPHETAENRARALFQIPYAATPPVVVPVHPRHDKLRIRRIMHSYRLLILREPGEKFIFGDSQAYQEGVDTLQRTVWSLDFTDQLAVWQFFREAFRHHLAMKSSRQWELYCKGKRLPFKPKFDQSTTEWLDGQLTAWFKLYPNMPPQQAIHRIFLGRCAGVGAENVDLHQRAVEMHRRYQRMRNEFDRYVKGQVANRHGQNPPIPKASPKPGKSPYPDPT